MWHDFIFQNRFKYFTRYARQWHRSIICRVSFFYFLQRKECSMCWRRYLIIWICPVWRTQLKCLMGGHKRSVMRQGTSCAPSRLGHNFFSLICFYYSFWKLRILTITIFTFYLFKIFWLFLVLGFFFLFII